MLSRPARKHNRFVAALLATAVTVAAAPGLAQDTAEQESAETVDYSDVLANPDDPDINFRYARRMIEEGQLNRAAASLERILILAPDADQIRLLYGIVLFRLGNTEEAERELEATASDNLSESDARAREQTLAAIRRTRRDVQGSFGVTAGLHVDTNRNAFPTDGQFQVDIPGAGETTFEADGEENTDVGEYLMLDGRATFDTGLQRLPGVTVEAAGLIDNQEQEHDLDLLSGLAGASATYFGDTVDVTPKVAFRQIALGGETYLREFTGRVRLSRNLGSTATVVFGDLIAAYEDYSPTERAPFAQEQDGKVVAGLVGVRHAPTDRLQFAADVRLKRKSAQESFEAFQGYRLRGDVLFVATRGVSLTAETALSLRSFDDPDPFVSATETRDDKEFFGRIGASVTAARLSEAAGLMLPSSVTRNLQFSLAGQYRAVDSNLPNFDYDNYRAEFTIAKRFPF
jgi:tetratricopeptide (TPR) repeat protein